ncbi:MAG: glycoside hydrolase family 2 TIM barrel-domain containing protein [Cyclobacteriaceae bacterium]
MRKILVLILAAVLSYHNLWSQVAQDSVLQYTMKTRWSDEVNPEEVWPNYPRPQMVRDDWQNLNGYWQYAISSKEKNEPKNFEGEILVPFAVESALSEVKRTVGTDNYLWYKKTFETPELEAGEKLLLHFGAVDWESTVYVNGTEVGTHRGGYDPFTFDVTKHLQSGEQELIVRVWDPTDEGMQGRGKQVNDPRGIWYTPVTGIWQTVWLENVPQNYIKDVKVTPDIDQKTAKIDLQFPALSSGFTVLIKALADGKEVSSKQIPVGVKSEEVQVLLDIKDPVLWSPDNPFLYDLQISLRDQEGQVIDDVESYFGMRKISLGKDPNGYTRILLNNEPLFQFGLLDQGWWPDGLYTAPTEEAMVYDIKVTKDLGFNMLRKHVKVEPARFYYHCDKMGMLVWQDMPSGFNTVHRDEQHVKHDARLDWERPLESAIQFEQELKSMIDNFHSFPSIVVWVPLNEGWGQYDTKRIADWTKAYDPTRLVDAPSGWADRGAGDMIDVHLYPGPGMELPEKDRATVLGEFGGLGWPVEGHLWWNKRNWGYLTYQDQDTYQQEFKQIVENLAGLISWGLSGAIYTQTTDVEGEVNGLMTYDREIIKLDSQKVKQWIEPLYKSWWHKHILLSDSEHEAQEWKVSFKKPDANWLSSDYVDFNWVSERAPFSTSENPFLPSSTAWKSDELYARKTFYLNTRPQQIYLKYYAPRTKVKLYLNGELITELSDGGGRKRHYTHIHLEKAEQYLKTGENILAVEVLNLDNQGAFDLGLYTTDPLKENPAKGESTAVGAESLH